MLIDRGLEQRIKEVFTEFLIYYPDCNNYREKISGLTLNYMVLNLINQPEERFESKEVIRLEEEIIGTDSSSFSQSLGQSQGLGLGLGLGQSKSKSQRMKGKPA